ncbi:hypothetical protein MMC29_002966 [Sticta canariensis]|nr:hypothetical protein [Sticta canariensis]
MIEKTRGLNVDCIAYDLEDSVIAAKKVEARANICDFLNEPRPPGIGERAVRINSIASGLAEDDLNEVLKSSCPDTLVLPKVNCASDIAFVTDMMKHHQCLRHKSRPISDPQCSPIGILALIESAKAVSNLSSICKASPYLVGLIFAAEDFALDLSLTRTPSLSEFLYARSAIVTECRAHELPSVIDLVCTSYKGPEGKKVLEEECVGGKNLGFNGKQCIHPTQIEITQQAFAPSETDLAWAVRISIAGRKADSQGRGAWTLDGKMIDAPVMGKAKRLLDRAQACGMDVEAANQKWQHQEPE